MDIDRENEKYSNKPYRDPASRREWQEAVDYSQALLAIDSARQYGLITGGPHINWHRCVDLLERGKAMGFKPRPDAVDRLLGGEINGRDE